MSSLHVWREDAPLIATCECGCLIAPRYRGGNATECSECSRARRKAAERAAEVDADAFDLRVRRITSGASFA